MLKSCFITGKTLDDVYFQLLSEIYKHGRVNYIDSGSYEGICRLEFDFVAGTIEFPLTRPLAPIFPPNTPPVTTDEDIEKYFINYLMDGSNLAENEHYRYATWINGGEYILPKVEMNFYEDVDDTDYEVYSNDGSEEAVITVPNQIEWCIKHYKEKGFGNNHCYIQIGYPESSFAYDVPYTDPSNRQTSPCLRGIDTHMKRDNNVWKLCFAVSFRSWDLFAAFPENIGGIILLQSFMADQLSTDDVKVEVGALSFSCLKLHCYDYQIGPLKLRLGI